MSREIIHTTKVIASQLLQATPEDQRAFFALLKNSPNGMKVATAIANYQLKNPKHNTFARYHPDHAIPFIMRAVFSPLTIGEAKDAMDTLFKIKHNQSQSWPPKVTASILSIAKQMNSDQCHYLNICEIGLAGFLPPPPKPNALVLWWDRWASPHIQVRKDFHQGRGLQRFISFPR